ncbi:MAG TPA: tRNA (guanosine(37)-N1)-methyltransferase TrmD [Patescibacteria group bacterium]|jgi:tRNA (guanine37-N1)-methyltransferase|nr:tRNA (guanosine(37)-N1)-methyltransferase TrmD [Patescibacteria group bacterium]
MIEFDVITIFPEIVEIPLTKTILKRAIDEGRIRVRVHQLRDHAEGPHRRVDDQPYGGGGGMLMKPEPIFAAVEFVREKFPRDSSRTILLSPQGARFEHSQAVRLSLEQRIILVCGRYEGVDERVRTALVDEEISIGDYVLTGGELPAMVLIDAVSRLVPGVVGEGESVLRDTFAEGQLQYPQYTRPAVFRGIAVPDVLLSGRHEEIETWRGNMALENTKNRRPDLLVEHEAPPKLSSRWNRS